MIFKKIEQDCVYENYILLERIFTKQESLETLIKEERYEEANVLKNKK